MDAFGKCLHGFQRCSNSPAREGGWVDGVRPCLSYFKQALGEELIYSDAILGGVTEKVKERLAQIGVASLGCSHIGGGLCPGLAEGADTLLSKQQCWAYRGT